MSRRSSRRHSDVVIGNTAPVQFAVAKRRTGYCMFCFKEKPVEDFDKPGPDEPEPCESATSSDGEEEHEPEEVVPKRRPGVSAEAHGAFNQRRADFTPKVFEKTQQDWKKLMKALRKCPFFHKIGQDILETIADSMEIEHYEAGQLIVKQGDTGRSGYVILKGRVDVCDDSEDSSGKMR